MLTSLYCPSTGLVTLPCIHRVDAMEPMRWLRAGYRDFRSTWRQSWLYGFIPGIAGLALLISVISSPQWVMALAGGFLILAPMLAIGCYRISWRLERGGSGAKLEISGEDRPLTGNAMLFGMVLAMLFAWWIDLSALATALLTRQGLSLALSSVGSGMAFRSVNVPYIAVSIGVGALLAALVFSISVVTLPMLLERSTDLVTAIATSLAVVKENPAAMSLWAATIALSTFFGMATFFVGFMVIFPMLGHASWHAYRGLVEPERSAA